MKFVDLIGKKFNRLIAVKLLYKDKHKKYVYQCLCDCGQYVDVIGARLVNGSTKSCGCLQRERVAQSNSTILIGQKYGYLTIIRRVANKYTSGGSLRTMYLCKCDCGTEKVISSSSISSRRTKSCGCYKKLRTSETNFKDISGKQFGNLTVISVYDRIKTEGGYEKIRWLCKCKCGRQCIVRKGDLVNGRTESCGNCGLLVNGIKVSKPQLELKSLIGFCLLNYRTVDFYIDIVCVRNNRKIAIEYDEWFWHGGQLQKDELRKNKLIDAGWKVLRIRTNNTKPDEQSVLNYLDILAKSRADYIDYELKWGQGEYFSG